MENFLYMKANITQRLLSSINSKNSIYDVVDSKLKGFILRVYPSGKLVYYVRPKRGVMRKIGNSPAFTPGMAREVAAEAIRSIVTGEQHPVLDRDMLKENDPTLHSFIEFEYTPYFQVTHRNDKNLSNLNVFPELMEIRISKLTLSDIEAWRLHRQSSGISPSTINRNINALKACLQFGVEKGYLNLHPLTGIKRLSVDVENRDRHLTPNEEKRLRGALKSTSKRLRSMVLLSMNTGIRQGELFSLEWMSVTEGTLAVESGKSKSRRTRRIPLNKEARSVLDNWGRMESGLVFPSHSDKQLTSVRKSWNTVLKNAKINNFRWHDLRHHFASKLVMAAVPLNTVRELLGHSDIKMTLRYSHLAPGHMREAVETLNL